MTKDSTKSAIKKALDALSIDFETMSQYMFADAIGLSHRDASVSLKHHSFYGLIVALRDVGSDTVAEMLQNYLSTDLVAKEKERADLKYSMDGALAQLNNVLATLTSEITTRESIGYQSNAITHVRDAIANLEKVIKIKKEN